MKQISRKFATGYTLQPEYKTSNQCIAQCAPKSTETQKHRILVLFKHCFFFFKGPNLRTSGALNMQDLKMQDLKVKD